MLGDHALANCDLLYSITVDEANKYFKSIDGNLYTEDGKILIKYAKFKQQELFVVPDGVEEIADAAFEFSYHLKEVKLPDGLKVIGNRAFLDSTSLEKINIPNSVTDIGGNAFHGCAINFIELPDGIFEIESYTFQSCSNLTSAIIPNSLSTMFFGAFYECNSFDTIYYKGTEEEWEEITIDSDENESILSASVYYYSAEEPDKSGNYWCYDEDGNIFVWPN